ncbi:MAG: DALR anticodon-binding domain-containing protein, partial [Candidatus Shikimatogenerans sp. JK-2022]|nr:DALR anticodon-binding domain-containing protein [Candidatus Shikimatogenerans bostrichidophilus]
FEKKMRKELIYIANKYKINIKDALKYSKYFKLVNKELIKWENKDKDTIYIWNKINKLVYKGFIETYKKLNIKFNETIYESNIYLLGKKKIRDGILKRNFYYDKDNSIYYLYKGKKIILLRKNGTSLYLTQEIGTLFYRLKKYKKLKLLIYVVGNEQTEHFKIFFNIIKKLNLSTNCIFVHCSYNTVNYLGKKIKSRYYKSNTTNLIFIDDLIYYMNKIIKKESIKKGKINVNINNIDSISLGTIKYQFLKINPKKIIDFDFNNIFKLKGNTGIYIQYTYVRILSILKKNKFNIFIINKNIKFYLNIIKNNEKDIIKLILEYYKIITYVKKKYDISILTTFLYNFTKKINYFYNRNKIINLDNIYKKNFRLIICKIILNFLYNNMKILGIPILKNI